METTVTIHRDVTVDLERIGQTLENFAFLSDWMDDYSVADGLLTVTFSEYAEEEYPDRIVSLDRLAEAYAVMAGGHHWGQDPSDLVELSEYHQKAAMDILLNPDDADADSITVDIAAQMAIFGGVIFA